MQVRAAFFGRGKLRPVWRILLFVATAMPLFWALALLLRSLVAEWPAGGLGLALDGAALTLALLIASYVMMRWIEARPLAALGLPLEGAALGEFLRGSAIGAAIITVLVLIQLAAGWTEVVPDSGAPTAWAARVAGLAILFLLAAAAEELLFRGYAFQVLVEGLGSAAAVIVASVGFALVHATNPGVDGLALVNIGLAGALMAVAYLRTWSLWVPLGLHWAWNWVMAAVFDLPVSGLAFDVPGYDLRTVGPEIVTGGGFGPEAGLLMTFAMGVAIVWVLRTDRLSRSRRIAALGPLVAQGEGAKDDRSEGQGI